MLTPEQEQFRITNLIKALNQLRTMHYAGCGTEATVSHAVPKYLSYDKATFTLTFEVIQSMPFGMHRVTIAVSDPKDETGKVRLGCDCKVIQKRGCCPHSYVVCQHLANRLSRIDDEVRVTLRHDDRSPLLRGLDQLIEDQARTETAKPVTEAPERRIVWRVQITNAYGRYSLTVFPVEQTMKKDGVSWKKGTRLNTSDIIRPEYQSLFVGPKDRDLITFIAGRLQQFRPGYGYGPSPSEIIEKLAGSSRVFFDENGEDVPLEIHAGKLGMTCSVNGDKVRIMGLCDNTPILGLRTLLQLDENTLLAHCGELLYLIKVDSKRFRDFAVNMIHTPTELPMAEAAEVLSRLAQLSQSIPIEVPAELTAGDLIADRTTYLEMVPTQPKGLIARVRTKPIPTGATVLPGDLRLPSYVADDGKVRRLSRDPNAEIAQAQAIAMELNLRQFNVLTDWDYRLTSDDEVIDFVSSLAERQHRKLAEQAVLAAPASESTELIVANDGATTALVPMPSESRSFGTIPETADLKVVWPQGGEVRVTREIEADALEMAVEDNVDWFGLSGTITVDGHRIPLVELLKALKAGRQVVALGNGLYARISDEFYNRLQAIGDLVHHSSKGLEVDITAAPVLSQLVDVRESLQLCKAWEDMLKKLDPSKAVPLDPPISLTADLREYQLEGYRWMKRLSEWGVGGCLADDMGLGKTVQALALLLTRVEEGPILVVAPMSVGFNWLRETQRFAPSLRVVDYREANREEVLKEVSEGDIVIVSYALLQRDAEKFWEVDWGTLVLDEAQNVKNATTKTARAVRDIKAKWRLALTGTPVENQLSELWALFRAISPGLFGSWERFRERFATPIERNNDTRRRYALSKLIQPFILRRTKNEVLKELPERTEIQRVIELSDEERRLYEDARVRIVAELMGLDFGGSKDHRFEVLAGITKLRQLACHPRLCDKKWAKSSAKLDALVELVHDLRAENHRALIFSQFTSHLHIVRETLDEAGVKYQYLDGSSTSKQRQAAVDAFQSGEGDVFLISLKAGGTGLNLTAADYVIHLDPWWNPAVEDQATDRAHRIGQTRPVTVYKLVAKDTIEEKILSLHDRKRELVSALLDGTDETAKFSTNELIDLIKTSGSKAYERTEAAGLAEPKGRGRPKKVKTA